jgi:hypothetical protein
MHFPQVKEQYVADYLDALAVGATHEEAVKLVAIENEVSEAEVLSEVECSASH